MNLAKYNKFIVALVAAVAVFGLGAEDGVFDANDAYQTIAAFLGALGVYQVRNTPKDAS